VEQKGTSPCRGSSLGFRVPVLVGLMVFSNRMQCTSFEINFSRARAITTARASHTSSTRPWRRQLSVRAFLNACLVAFGILSVQATHSEPHTAKVVETLGGELEFSWNHSLLENLHIGVSDPTDLVGVTSSGFDRFLLSDASELTVVTEGQSVRELSAGVVGVRGGYNLSGSGIQFAIRDFTLRRRPGSTPIFDLVTPYGETPFFVDNLLVEPGTDGRSVSIRTMDLRISRWLALRLDKPEVTNWPIATLRMQAHLATPTTATFKEACPSSARWPGMAVPGHPGEKYQVDVLMEGFVPQLTGCDDCSGPAGHGRLKITPTTILRNNVNDGTSESTVAGDAHGTSTVKFAADVSWRNMFSAECPPYGNDQHPFLTWALYRINSKDQIEQIAHAGVKHAHTAQNGQCSDNPKSNHVLGRGCADVYGTGDNDANDAIGPRSEVIPATGQWGRCGSIYDPECTGKLSGFAGPDPWKYRLAVAESEIAGKSAEGARFFLEAWYIVRDDVDPYNSMANIPIEFVWEPTNRLWVVKPTGPAKLGSVIDRWVDPTEHRPGADNQELRTPEGRVKVAVISKELPDGSFRYEYAVMNLDFSLARTKGSGPNLRVQDSHGLDGIAIATILRGKISNLSFAGPDQSSSWTFAKSKSELAWKSDSEHELRWGTLLRFGYDADYAPCETILLLSSSSRPRVGKIITFQTRPACAGKSSVE